jgi:hypothetical protein
MNPEKPPLYDRLGGVYSIATVVDDFIDARLNASPLVDEAYHRVPHWAQQSLRIPGKPAACAILTAFKWRLAHG